MITSSLMMLVMVAMFTVFFGVQRTSVRESARSEAGDALRISMERMTRDIRQATRVCPGSDATRIDIDTYIEGAARRVVYAAAGDVLTRQVGSAAFSSCAALSAGTSSTRVFAHRLVSTSVFTYNPDVTSPSAVSIGLQVRPEHFRSDDVVIALTSEAQLRNGG